MKFTEMLGRMRKLSQLSPEIGSDPDEAAQQVQTDVLIRSNTEAAEVSTATGLGEYVKQPEAPGEKRTNSALSPFPKPRPWLPPPVNPEVLAELQKARENMEAQRAARKAAMNAQDKPVSLDWDEQVVRGDRGVSFRVDDVETIAEGLVCEPIAEQLKDRFANRLLIPTGDHFVVDWSHRLLRRPKLRDLKPTQAVNLRQSTLGFKNHPLIEAVHTAFSEHRPLVLSPDAVWLVIAQGFSSHVKENAEALRASFVRHEGKKELVVRASSFTRVGFAEAIAEISAQIRQGTPAVIHDALICNFSTTTPDVRTASEIVLMDTFSRYFTFGACICGIPRVTLQGTPEDWETMRARLEILATYDLEWWVECLRPIFDEFVLTAEGRPSPQFWRAIYKPREAYGGDMITGWIADLFPYLGQESAKTRNHVLGRKRHNWALKVEEGIGPAGVGSSGLPSGICKVALKVHDLDVDLFAGFVGVSQNVDDLALGTVIDWFVVSPETTKTERDLRRSLF
jgi:hypothetical protein